MVKIMAADPCASTKPNLVKNAVVATAVDTAAAAVAEIAMVAVAVAVTIVVAVAAVIGDQTS